MRFCGRFSEVLYYFPLRQVLPILRKGLSLLTPETGVLILSMSSNPKAWLIWALIRAVALPTKKVSLRAGAGLSWNVKSYNLPVNSAD